MWARRLILACVLTTGGAIGSITIAPQAHAANVIGAVGGGNHSASVTGNSVERGFTCSLFSPYSNNSWFTNNSIEVDSAGHSVLTCWYQTDEHPTSTVTASGFGCGLVSLVTR